MIADLSVNNVLAAAGGGDFSFILIMVLMFVVMYFFSIRPQKKQEKEVAAMRNSVDVGDKIITIGGVTGVVIDAKEGAEEIVIETGGDKTRLRVKRWAIQMRIPLVVPTDDIDDDDYDDEDDIEDSVELTQEEPKKRSLFGRNK